MSATRLLYMIVIAFGVFAFAPQSSARPRDSVMSNAFLCAGIGDSKMWLDCYYGAAQPARQALRMQPAPASQTMLVTTPPGGTPSAGDAALHDSILSQAFSCKDVSEDKKWLDCYYAAAQPARAQLNLRSTALEGPSPAPTVAAIAPQPFGVRKVRPEEISDSADHVLSRMASYRFNSYGIFVVTLANGQIWKQVAGDTSFAHWTKPAGNYTVRLSHGALGSYDLAIVNMPGVFKVRRSL